MRPGRRASCECMVAMDHGTAPRIGSWGRHDNQSLSTPVPRPVPYPHVRTPLLTAENGASAVLRLGQNRSCQRMLVVEHGSAHCSWAKAVGGITLLRQLVLPATGVPEQLLAFRQRAAANLCGLLVGVPNIVRWLDGVPRERENCLAAFVLSNIVHVHEDGHIPIGTPTRGVPVVAVVRHHREGVAVDDVRLPRAIPYHLDSIERVPVVGHAQQPKRPVHHEMVHRTLDVPSIFRRPRAALLTQFIGRLLAHAAGLHAMGVLLAVRKLLHHGHFLCTHEVMYEEDSGDC
mmetsp:Transcript_31495/g.75435  ORF Transcript_31495/g.75435 Transcript_31495/m.75435 type:complete len:289 (-) Transcript_31495:552-1418(-)